MIKKGLFILLCMPIISFGQNLEINWEIIYTSPKNNSILHYPNTNIVIKSKFIIDNETLEKLDFNIIGDISGHHDYDMQLALDQRTIIIIPKVQFDYSEKVSCMLRMKNEEKIILSLLFSITSNQIDYSKEYENSTLSKTLSLPQYSVTINNNPIPFNLFFKTDTSTNNSAFRPVNILSSNGDLIFSKTFEFKGHDWKINKNNSLTYYDKFSKGWFVMNEYFEEIDSVYCQNGFQANSHEFVALSNGNYLLIAYDEQPYAMDTIVVGGDPNAIIEGLIIQEIDSNKNLIFQWRSWDYFHITDNIYLDLTSSLLKFIHANAIDIDFDGTILLSSRHLDEITKINRNSGDIIWRWGGSQNQFALSTNDYPFSYQHCVRSLGNNRYILFDNGNYSGQYNGGSNISRGLEYELDTTLMLAIKRWEFIHPDSLYGKAKGSIQRLPNKSTLINWGKDPKNNTGAVITEIDSNQIITFELETNYGTTIYRAHKFDWYFDSFIIGCTDYLALNYNVNAIIDDSSCTYISSTSNEYNTSNKRLINIKSVLGQEISPQRKHTPLFYLYDDGSVEKRIIIE